MNDSPGIEVAGSQPEVDHAATPQPHAHPSTPEAPEPDRSQDVPDPDSNGAALTAPTVLDTLRQQYQEATEDRRTILPILPGRFYGTLAARIRPIPWSDTRRRARKIARTGANEESELDFAAGIIAQATESIMIRSEDGSGYVPLHESIPDWRDGDPIRFDARLAQVLGIENPPAPSRSICRLVFKNPAALNDFYVDVNNFLSETTEGDDDEGGDRPT